MRHRRELLKDELEQALQLTDQRPLRVTSLACGPAAEVFDVLLQYPELADQVRFTLMDVDVDVDVDVDQEALIHVQERLLAHGLDQAVRLERRNLLHLCIGRQTLDLSLNTSCIRSS